MLRVENAQKDYATAARNIESKAFILAKKQQEIAKNPPWLATIYRLINCENRQQISLGRECQRLLDKIEKVPVVFSEDPSKTIEQKNYYAACLKAAKLVVHVLSSSQSTNVKGALQNLMQRVTALQYRIEAVNGGLDRLDIDLTLTKQLCEAALSWKETHSLIVKKELTAEEIKKLEEVSTYPEFAKQILSKRSMNCFFNWILQNNNEVGHYVEFPATCSRLKSVYIASRIGRLPKTFQIRKEEKGGTGTFEKVATLPFLIKNKTEHINILDETQTVELDWNDGTKIFTINEIFNVFSRKNNEVGDLEMFKDGIRYWNCHQIGSIDLTLADWWNQLPIIEEITKEEMEKRIDDLLPSNEWIVFAKSSRTTPDMDLDKRHGYFEIAIPTSDGTYRVYPFGIFPNAFPETIPELVSFLGNTNRAKISYPDENFFYTHRQQASHPIKLTDDEAKLFMRNLQKELIRSRFGQLIFQFGAENCAYWAQSLINTIDAKKHNFFKLEYVKSYPLNPLLKAIFNFLRNVPEFCRKAAIKAVDRCFWSSRGMWVLNDRKKSFKSHHTSPVRNECVIYQPGYLHQQIAEGKIKGRIYLGNC